MTDVVAGESAGAARDRVRANAAGGSGRGA